MKTVRSAGFSLSLITLLTLATLQTLHAAPRACFICATNGILSVTWCDVTPGATIEIQWSENATDFLTLEPNQYHMARVAGDPTQVIFSIEMTTPTLYLRLVEVGSAGFSLSPARSITGDHPTAVGRAKARTTYKK